MNAVITGASRGVGFEVARIFARHGYDLYLSARDEGRLMSAIEKLQTEFPNCTIDGHPFDLGKKEQAQLFGEWVVGRAGIIDVLVNNAGTFVPGTISEEPDGALEHMLEVNLHSAYHLTRAVLPRMIAQQSGHIFTMCSIAALGAYPNGGAYSISKYALLGFTKNLRYELRPHNIKVTAIIPGAIYTDSWKGSGVEPGRIMKAEDIAILIHAATRLSPQATTEEIIIRPQLGDL